MNRRRVITSIPITTFLTGCTSLSKPGTISNVYLDNEGNDEHKVEITIQKNQRVLFNETYKLTAKEGDKVAGINQKIRDAVVEVKLIQTGRKSSFSASSLSGCYSLLVRVTPENDIVFFHSGSENCPDV